MYVLLAAVGLVGAVVFGVLFLGADSAPKETVAATAASAALLFAATMMLGHLAKLLNEQKDELQQQADQLRRQTEYLRWMQQTAERLITAYIDSRTPPSQSSSRAPSQTQSIRE